MCLLSALALMAAANPAHGQATPPTFDAQKFEDQAKELLQQLDKPDFDQQQFQQQIGQLMQQFRDETQGMTPDQVDQIRQKMMEHLQPLILKSMPTIIQRMRQGFMDRIKQQLDCTEEEFNALKPGIQKIMDCMQATGAGMGPRRPGGGPGAFTPPGQQGSPVLLAQQELHDVLADPNAKPDLIKSKTDNLRKAREQAAHDLDVARAELRPLLTIRQESVLVANGLLE